MDITITDNNLKKKESVSAESTINDIFELYSKQEHYGYECMPYYASSSFTPKNIEV